MVLCVCVCASVCVSAAVCVSVGLMIRFSVQRGGDTSYITFEKQIQSVVLSFAFERLWRHVSADEEICMIFLRKNINIPVKRYFGSGSSRKKIKPKVTHFKQSWR